MTFTSGPDFLQRVGYFWEWSLSERIAVGFGAVACTFLVRKLWSNQQEKARTGHWHNVIRFNELKRHTFQDSVLGQVGDPHVTREDDSITDLPYNELKEQLQDGRLTAVTVLQAYQRAALLAQERTNCVCFFIKEALQVAEQLDAKYKDMNKPALFGIPFSVKESIQITGYDSTRGYVQDLDNPATEDALQVDVLRQLGAIPFAITNLPQSMISFACSNPIYGTSCHPLDPKRTCGGSSGGEGALLAMKASRFGLGTDVAGSVRIPAHFCGICALKPTGARSSTKGTRPFCPGRPNVPVGTVGPMAQDVEMLIDVYRHSINGTLASKKDPHVSNVPFNESLLTDSKKLRIGYYDYDGYFQTTAAIKRAVVKVKNILEEEGHTLVPFFAPNMQDLWYHYLRTTSGDLGVYLDDMATGGIIDPHFAKTASSFRQSKLTKWLDKKTFKNFPRVLRIIEGDPETAADIRKGYVGLYKFRDDFVQAWNDARLDALLCPAHVGPALPHITTAHSFTTFSYTALFNVVDFPSGVVPVTRVTDADEKETAASFVVEDMYDQLIRPAVIDGTVGLPIGVQIVAMPYQEETCLRLMKQIQEGTNDLE